MKVANGVGDTACLYRLVSCSQCNHQLALCVQKNFLIHLLLLVPCFIPPSNYNFSLVIGGIM